MKHVELFENFGASSNSGPFLVMYYNLYRGEKDPVGTFLTLQEAEESVWQKTLEQVKSYNNAPIERNWENFLENLSHGLVKSVSELEENLEELRYEECYYAILKNGTNMMEEVLNQWEVIAKNLK